ncbi:MAG: glycosyltransferase family 4 protein, partial [Bryobacteraceae bacterium]
GSTRSNLIWLAYLARRGHACRVVCPSLEAVAGEEIETAERDGISIFSVKDLVRRAGVIREHIRGFRPDWLLVSSEDVSHVLLREAGRSAPSRLIYLAHTPQFFPFGPESWNPDTQASAIVRQASGIVAIGHHMAGYVRQHLGVSPVVIHPPIYGREPYARFSCFEKGMILMINPCKVKGIDIFLALADRFPGYTFGALLGWGTTRKDIEQLSTRPNIRLLASVKDIEEVLSQSRLLLMPSVWYEGFGLIAMEAMLRGLPVLASNSGGLMEAKQGTGFIIPVRPVERYEPVFDENHMPEPVLEKQEIEPWADALSKLLKDRDVYWEEADRSRNAALRFVSSLDASNFESFLVSLETPGLVLNPPAKTQANAAADPRFAQLSAARRALLLHKLKQRDDR